MIDQNHDDRGQGCARFGACACAFGHRVRLFLRPLDGLKLAHPIPHFVTQYLKIDPFVRVTLMFSQKGETNRRCRMGHGRIDQIAEITAQLFINKRVFLQPQLAEIEQINQLGRQLLAQKIAGHGRLAEILFEKRIMRVDQLVTHVHTIPQFPCQVEIGCSTAAPWP